MSSRQKIMDTMYHLIAKKGYDKTSIGLICSEIGISKPAVYYYFKSKEEILVAILNEVINDTSYVGSYFDRFFSKKIYAKEEYKELLLNAGSLITKNFTEDLEFHSVLFEMYVQSKRIPVISGKMQEFACEAQIFLTELLTYGVEILAFPSDFDVHKNAEILQVLIQGIENSIIFDTPIDCVMVWEESIRRMFLETC